MGGMGEEALPPALVDTSLACVRLIDMRGMVADLGLVMGELVMGRLVMWERLVMRERLVLRLGMRVGGSWRRRVEMEADRGA
jgi:hypothetical protein